MRGCSHSVWLKHKMPNAVSSREPEQPYVGRIAPSPTGLLHAGHAATFWTAYRRAMTAGGTLLFRNEDLDPHRSRPEFVEAMVEDLLWLGIRWQKPVVTQSERLPMYREAIQRLVAAGLVYPCRCSRRDLARMMHAPHEDPTGARDQEDEPVYNGHCRDSRISVAADPLTHNLRFRVPDGESIAFEDLSAGPQSFTAGRDFGDFLVWRKPTPGDPEPTGLPSYQLACVVDDAAMGITEVVRGRDLLKSTARQILLQRALRLPTPMWFHTPLAVDAEGRRLAKRHDALSLRHLREKGASPAEVLALVNFETRRQL